MPKVYLVQMPTKWNKDRNVRENLCDVSPAAEFGEITPPLFPKHGASYFTQWDIVEVRKQLKDFTDEDSILLLGDPAAIGLACSLAAEVNLGRYSVLRWDRARRAYLRMTFNLKGN